MKENKLYIVLTPFFPSKNSHVGSYIFDQVQALNKYSDFEIKVIKTVSIFSFETDYIYNNIQVHIFHHGCTVPKGPFFLQEHYLRSPASSCSSLNDKSRFQSTRYRCL